MKKIATGSLAVGAATGIGYYYFGRKQSNTTSKNVVTPNHTPFVLAKYTFPDPSEYQLNQVNLVFRHGARTPLILPPYWAQTEYKPDLLNHPEETYIPHELTSLHGEDEPPKSKIEAAYLKRGLLPGGSAPGQLTAVGAKQMHTLGENLRRIYVEQLKFLNPTHSVEEVHVRTTNMNRTLESARCVNAGLFHVPLDSPISIFTSDASTEIIYPNYFACPMLKKLTRWAWDDPDKLPGLKEQREHVQKQMGISTDEHKMHLVEVRDNLASEHVHGITKNHPSPSVVKKIEDAAVNIMHAVFVGKEKGTKSLSMKLAIGPLIDLMINNLDLVEEKAKKMYMFSGHDTTLIPLLSAFGIWAEEWPYYGSSISLELWSKKSDPSKKFVRTLYNGEAFVINGCDSDMCPLDMFKNALKDVRINPADYQRSCLLDEIEDDGNQSIPGIKG